MNDNYRRFSRYPMSISDHNQMGNERLMDGGREIPALCSAKMAPVATQLGAWLELAMPGFI